MDFSGLGDGAVELIWADDLRSVRCGEDPAVDEGGLMLGVTRIGPSTLHPLKDAVLGTVFGQQKQQQQQCDEGADTSFLLVFRVDPALREAAQGDSELMKSLVETAIIEPLGKAIDLEEVIIVPSASKSFPLSSLIENPMLEGSFNLSLLEELTCRQQVVHSNVLGVGSEGDAKRILATLFAPTAGGINATTQPVLVAAEGNIFVGQRVQDDSFQVFTTLDTEDLSNINATSLASQFASYGSIAVHGTAKATYELLGNWSDGNKGGCVTLTAQWKVQRSAGTRLLGPPALTPEDAIFLVQGSTGGGLQRTDSESGGQVPTPDRGLKVMKTLASYQPGKDSFLSANGYDAAWEAHVNAFVQSARSGSLFSLHGMSGQHSKNAMEDENDGEFQSRRTTLEGRSNFDFTELFWEQVVIKAKSYEQILFALRLVMTSLQNGVLLPYIHKSNNTLLGNVCRQAIKFHVAKSQTGGGTDPSQGSEAQQGPNSLPANFAAFQELAAKGEATPDSQKNIAASLMELGAWKLTRDFDAWFHEVGVKADLLEELLPVAPLNDTLALSARFSSLREALQVASTALTFRCPRQQVRALAVASLRHCTERQTKLGQRDRGKISKPVMPTFVLPIRSQLPWVRDDAAGLSSLPAPRFWQLVQSDKFGRVTQTTRLAPYGAGLELAESPLESCAAQDAARLIGEPGGDATARQLLRREYRRLCADRPSATKNTELAGISMVCLQRRHVCLE
mmetsp:Transcript_4050/g.7772  ORF Transcript_4050/g.7772 Transcript_4050/m.7772 type:complete len:736 (-) Transcript_4050:102-2309(-)